MIRLKSSLIFFALLLIVPSILSITACSFPAEKEGNQDDNTTPYTYLALGDSYTICESIDPAERWPIQLQRKLVESDMIVEDPTIIARTGWRTDDMLKAAKSQLKKTEQFDIVSLLIGVNNEFQGWDPEDFTPEFEKCLEYAISKCKTEHKGVFVVSIPDYGYTPYGAANQSKISKRLDTYNSICKKTAEAYDVPFYNITDISRIEENEQSLVAKDGLHPSAYQYGLWVDSFYQQVAAQFNQ